MYVLSVREVLCCVGTYVWDRILGWGGYVLRISMVTGGEGLLNKSVIEREYGVLRCLRGETM